MSAFSDEFLAEEFHNKELGIAFSRKMETLSLDLGSGLYPKNPFKATTCTGIDILDSANTIKCNLFSQDIPFDDCTADFVTAFDFIEHIPRLIVSGEIVRFRFVELMSDIYRVLKTGGLFFSHTPAFPSQAVFQDPTHVNFITATTFPNYFCTRRGNKGPGASRYGFKDSFRLVAQKMYSTHLLTLLQK
jgi:SAM-dependent methyltransferase